MTRADPAARPALALNAYFYAYIPMLLGIITLAAGVKVVIGQVDGSGSTVRYPVALALGGGVALYLAGDAAFRHALRIGTQRTRVMAAAVALAVTAVGVLLSAVGEIALLTVIVAAALATDTVEP
jgi:low temperature requirement protein LtrA